LARVFFQRAALISLNPASTNEQDYETDVTTRSKAQAVAHPIEVLGGTRRREQFGGTPRFEIETKTEAQVKENFHQFEFEFDFD
jgi:hypothetical protein